MNDKTRLADKLGAGTVEQLTDDECAHLGELIRAVRRSRFKAMMASIDQSLGHLPRPLRGPAKRILGV